MINPLLLLSGLACLLLGWNMPNHYPPLPSFHGELLAALGACLLFAGVAFPVAGHSDAQAHLGLSSAQGRLAVPTAAWVWAGAGMLPPLQYAAGQLAFRGDGVIGLLYCLGAAGCIYVGRLWAQLAGGEATVKTLCLTFVAGGMVAGAIALAQWLRLEGSWWAVELIDRRPFGNFAQANHFGLMMVLSIVAATALYEMRQISRSATYFLTISFFCSGILVSQSRAAVLGLLCVTGVWWYSRKRLPTRLKLPAVIFAIVSGSLLQWKFESIEAALFLAPEPLGPRDIGVRIAIWKHFLHAVAEHPWFGYGFNQGAFALSEVALHWPSSVDHATIYAHNIALDLMTWFGVPVGAAATIAIAAWMLSWLRPHPNILAMVQRHWLFAVWLAIIVQSLVEYPYAYAYFLLPAMLFAGAATGASPATNLGKVALTPRISRTACAVGLSTVVLLGVVTWEYLVIEGDFRATRFARLNFLGQPKHQVIEEPLFLDHLAALSTTARYELKPGMSAVQLELMRIVARRFQNLVTQMDYAKALALNGRMDLANQELRILQGLYKETSYAVIEKEWREWLGERNLLQQ